MSFLKRTAVILLFAILSVSLLPILGLPYEPLEVLASTLKQYVPSPTPFLTCLIVRDQDVGEGTVLVDRACASRRGWVVIYNQVGGEPGEAIGQTLVLFGVTEDVEVEIDLGNATPVLYGRLHQDLGERQVFDPENDPAETFPVEFNVALPALTPTPSPEQPTSTASPTAPPPEPTEPEPPTPTLTPTPEPLFDEIPPAARLLYLGALACVGLGGVGVVVALVYFLRRRA